MNISLAIPFFNTSKFIKELLNEFVLNDERISEIIILDDKSKDIEYEKLLEIIKNIDSNKIKVFRNKENLNIPLNKIEVLKYCNNDWIFLVDSDNYIVKETIDILYSLPEWKENYIYAPTNVKRIGRPSNQFNFTRYNDVIFNKDKLKTMDFFDRKLVCFMNMCNYFLNRKSYLKCMDDNLYIINDIINSIGPQLLAPWDSVLLFSIWLSANNNNILGVNGLIYYHRLYRSSTFYRSNKSKMGYVFSKCISLVQS